MRRTQNPNIWIYSRRALPKQTKAELEKVRNQRCMLLTISCSNICKVIYIWYIWQRLSQINLSNWKHLSLGAEKSSRKKINCTRYFLVKKSTLPMWWSHWSKCLYFGRNLNLAIFQKVDTTENVCTKTDLGAFQGSPSQKGKTQLNLFSFLLSWQRHKTVEHQIHPDLMGAWVARKARADQGNLAKRPLDRSHV